MAGITEKQKNIFHHAREIIKQDESIPEEEKEGIFKLIRVLVEVADLAPSKLPNQEESPTAFTQEIISRHALMAAVKQQIDELESLKKLSLNVTSSLDLQTVLDTVVAEAMRLVKNSRAAHIFLYSHGKLEFGSSLTAEGLKNMPVAMPRKEGLTATVVASGVPIIVEDITDHPLYTNVSQNWRGSIIGLPLKYNKSIVGVMNLSRSTVGGFTRAELRLIGLVADLAAVAISNASLHQQVAAQANTDSVTGLPNRRALDERIQEEIRFARRMNSEFSVVMMDLDGFKAVNDTYGHVVGDELLYSLFNYLAENIRPTDFLARYGGDELTLVSREANQDMAESVTQKIIDLVRGYKPAFAEKKNIQLGITAGIAIYPTHSKTAGDLLRAADAALYQAKKHHRGSYSIAKITTGPLDPITLPRKKPE
ncbi:MAG TPA: sensor domain-containing diguanylate cyclase [Anaerolineales bacterium]|nr:sensor domain-containing diguanylate cyclase [Anaerolineales bacterium]HMZ42094.1 sensor domain-containing diguanylate cyclase [Anaerolineales bacterium]HNA53624.1 sensor domain-containing diguanylate cyclase [Anaerolineales bacterium]HNE67256.1 sensor domain-containing diguanylate cyclase [Anaerolineales bacterium]HNF33441.1 sensor domain-containing diguanylate cyclase [Anaerolineales bacterium]